MSYNKNREETERLKDAKDFSKRSTSCIGTAKSSINAIFKKWEKSILLKSRKSILSSAQRPSVLTERRKTLSGHIVFFVQLEVRAIRFDNTLRRLNLPYLIAFMSDCNARLKWQLSWEIDDGSVCNSMSPWRRASGSM